MILVVTRTSVIIQLVAHNDILSYFDEHLGFALQKYFSSSGYNLSAYYLFTWHLHYIVVKIRAGKNCFVILEQLLAINAHNSLGLESIRCV